MYLQKCIKIVYLLYTCALFVSLQMDFKNLNILRTFFFYIKLKFYLNVFNIYKYVNKLLYITDFWKNSLIFYPRPLFGII